jgi:hypothetical protein
MSGTSLRHFVCRALEHKRIRFGDLRRLQRDILPARITTREQAEILIALDRSIDRADKDWRAYLVATIRDFVIWGSPPAGRIDRDKAEWLIAALSHGGPTARAIARSVAREALQVEDALLVFATTAKRKPPAASSQMLPMSGNGPLAGTGGADKLP